MTLQKHQFTRGETIVGTLLLQLKKPVRAKGLSLALIGEQIEHDQRTGQTTPYRVFDFTLPLDGEKEYAAGPLTYPFQITIPQNVSPARPEGALGTFISAAQALGGGVTLRWHLLGRLAVAGFDLTKKVSINVG